MAISDGTENWYGLGPLSVLLRRLKKLGARGCCLLGHPQYYTKLGFENVAGLVHEGVPREAFFALSFDGHFSQGEVSFHEGFEANGK